MSDVWSYLSGSRRRGCDKAAVSKQSSWCISDSTAAGSPSAALDQSGSLKLGSLAGTSDWHGDASLTDGGTASLSVAPLLSPATAPSVAASSSLFSPTTAQTVFQPAVSLRSCASLRDSRASSWVGSPHGNRAQFDESRDDQIGAVYAAKPPTPPPALPPADISAALGDAALQPIPPRATPPQGEPASQTVSPLSEWGAYKTPSASRQPTMDHTLGTYFSTMSILDWLRTTSECSVSVAQTLSCVTQC